MKVIHHFNPEHDIALAANLSNFTPPHAGRQLRKDLGYLPALWADDGDAILVDDADEAFTAWETYIRETERNGCMLKHLCASPRFVTWEDVGRLSMMEHIDPWGWDTALCAHLKRAGVKESLLPDTSWLESVRSFSHRRQTARILPSLRIKGTVGQAYECDTLQDVQAILQQHPSVVIKAPWSSSGRGVRFVSNSNLAAYERWLQNVLTAQQSVMVEPYYHSIQDFGMEFTVCEDGTLQAEGLSVFYTEKGAYSGNLLVTEQQKRDSLGRYIHLNILDEIIIRLQDCLKPDCYRGPLGVDMMIVEHQGEYLLHPCVEVNVRRTMGHVALALGRHLENQQGVMRIKYDGAHYHLQTSLL